MMIMVVIVITTISTIAEPPSSSLTLFPPFHRLLPTLENKTLPLFHLFSEIYEVTFEPEKNAISNHFLEFFNLFDHFLTCFIPFFRTKHRNELKLDGDVDGNMK